MNKLKQWLVLGGAATSVLAASLPIAAEDNYSPPKTSFGVPDVQGVWNYQTRTSLERPDAYGGELEVDEATMLEKMVSTPNFLAFLEATGAQAPGPENVGGYNGFWITPGDALANMSGKFRTSIIVDPVDGQIPWTEEGETVRGSQHYSLPMGRAESDGPEGRTLADRCLMSFASTAPFLSGLYNNNIQIVQSPTHVMILAEMVHNTRVVRIADEFRDLPFEQWMANQ
jgi:hypothetical protein